MKTINRFHKNLFPPLLLCLLMIGSFGYLSKNIKAPSAANETAKSPLIAEPNRSNDRSATSKARIVENYGKLPINFEANEGQTDESVKFLARGHGYTIFLTPT